MAKKKIRSWEDLRALALSLNLPHVIETTSWGQPTLKAHGKLWAWWSPSEHVPVFKTTFDERDFLIEVDPDTYFVTPHYKGHQLILARPENLDPEWARDRLLKTWRDMAPKRVLKAYDEAQAAAPVNAKPATKKKAAVKPKLTRKRA
jgi:hypothetical protein